MKNFIFNSGPISNDTRTEALAVPDWINFKNSYMVTTALSFVAFALFAVWVYAVVVAMSMGGYVHLFLLASIALLLVGMVRKEQLRQRPFTNGLS